MKSSLPFFISLILISLFFVGANASVPATEHPTVMEQVASLKGIDENDWDYCGLEAVVCEGEDPVAVIRRVAEEENFDADLLLRLSHCESLTGKMMIGDTFMPKYSYGLFQINLHYHPDITIEQAMDYEWSTRWTVNQIKAGRGWMWSCWDKI